MPSNNEEDLQVELSLDPIDDLPGDWYSWLESFILPSDLEVMLDKIEHLTTLLGHWEFNSSEVFAKLAECGSPFVPRVDGDAIHLALDQSPASIPISILSYFSDVRSDGELAELIRRCEASTEVLREWFLVATDDEKMVGHLIVGHGQPSSVAALSDVHLLMVHSYLHGVSEQ